MRNNDMGVGGALFTLGLIATAIVGWGMNIYKLWHVDVIDVKALLRIAGIFVGPLGAILGFI